MRTATIAEIAPRKMRVDLFDMMKQKSNSAMKNVSTLLGVGKVVHQILSESNSGKTESNVRPH